MSDASCPVCRTMLYYSDISDIASLSNASDASTIAFEDSKFIATLKLIRHHRDSRIIVASNWIHPLLALKEKLFKDLGITPLMISGKVPLVDRLDILNTFQNSAPGSDNSVLLLSMSACSEGLNIVSANVLINLDLPWNFSRLTQLYARIDRLGQSSDCFFYNLLAIDTIDSRIWDLVLRKKDISDTVLNGNGFVLKDLLSLLN